jgi:hypothetical protein
MFGNLLPLELQRHVLSYDATYSEYFTEEVLPEMMEMVWKRITYRFFISTIDFTIFVDDMYEMLSDFEEEEEEQEEEDEDDDEDYL